MALLWALGVLNLAVGLFSLFASVSSYRASANRNPASSAEPADQPAEASSVRLIVPCAGAEEGLSENLQALLEQDHPNYTVLFVVSDDADEAMPVIRKHLESYPHASVHTAGHARDESQKVHKLRQAVQLAGSGSPDIYAFADSDGRPSPEWLRLLTHPLEEQSDQIELRTGYRFYLARPGGFAALVRSVWNVGVLTLLGDHDRNFAWGGAMAIRRSDFEKMGGGDLWKGALSDDYALTHAVRRASGNIRFEPRCLVASSGHIGFLELLRWCRRQMAITRVYWPALFRVAALSQIAFSGFLVLGFSAAASGKTSMAILLAVILALSWASALARTLALGRMAPSWRPALMRFAWAYVLLVPLASLVTVQSVLRAAMNRRIEWRGYIYEMRSPNETLIVKTPTE